MKKIAIFFAEGYEEIEALTVVDLLRRAGIEIEMVSITGNKTVTGAHGIPVVMDKQFDEVDFNDVDMIVLPGGMPGTKNLEAFAPLMEKVDAFHKEGKGLAAICAAPMIYGHKGIVAGKKACIYPGMEAELQGAEVTYDKVTIAGNVITSRGMGCAIEFALAIVGRYKGTEAADKLAAAVVYER